MAQRPAAPTLSPAPDNNKLAYLEFDVPTDGAPTHAMVYVRDHATDRTHMYDARTQKLLPMFRTGKLLTLAENGTMPRRKRLSVAGLGAGTFTATVAFRAADDLEFGPTSPRSAPLERTPAPACGAPMLEPVSDTKMRVHFAVPHGCSSARVEFHENGSRHGLSVDPQTCKLRGYGGTRPQFAVTGDTTFLVTGLSDKISYTARVAAHNGIDWGDGSPSSKPVKLADHKPRAPCVPVLDQISSDSVRVFCAPLSNCTDAIIFFKNLGTGRDLMMVDSSRGNLLSRLENWRKASPRADCYKGVVVPGLSPDTEYEVYCKQGNTFGWSSRSPEIPGCKFRTLSDVEIIGTQTQAERDLELRRQAVDADADDDPPPASRPVKKEKKNGYAVDGFVVDTDEEEALAAEQPAKRRKETPPWDWTTASL